MSNLESLETLLTQALILCKEGKCDHITEEELNILSGIIHKPDTLCREEAAKYLGISLAKFYKYRELGIILPPKKRKGFKELEYLISDLNKSLAIIQLQEEDTH